MASERQIAANRRNARKSTGPRSAEGRKRASRNAYRHGLTLSIASTAAFAKQLDKLVREIAGDSKDAIMLERAREIAQAELDLARVRRAKVALIERASAFGELDPPQTFSTVTEIKRFFNALDRGRLIVPEPSDSSATMPSQEPDRSAEAVRRVLPELRKLDRYERRAAARRDRAVLNLLVEQRVQSLVVDGKTKPIFLNFSNGLKNWRTTRAEPSQGDSQSINVRWSASTDAPRGGRGILRCRWPASRSGWHS